MNDKYLLAVECNYTKVCNTCDIEKLVSEFSPGKLYIHWCKSMCKPCYAKYKRELSRKQLKSNPRPKKISYKEALNKWYKKTCWKCKQEKTVDMFSKSKTWKYMVLWICKKCKSIMDSNYYVKNTNKIRKYYNNWITDNMDLV